MPKASTSEVVRMRVPASIAVSALLAAAVGAQPRSVYVPMPDGVRLAVDVHLPGDGDHAVPALFELTRYWRAREHGRTGARLPALNAIDRAFLEHGYAVLKVDVRGTGASFGERQAEYGRQEARDCHALAEWAVRQPWCDGNLGAYGISYSGTTAELMAASGHPAVKAVVLGWSDFDTYRSPVRPYGLYAESLVAEWSRMVAALDRNDARRLGAHVARVDGDDDGALRSAAVAEHVHNFDVAEWIERCEFIDQPMGRLREGVERDSYLQASAVRWRAQVEAAAVPMLVFASWFDAGTARGALRRFRTYRNPQWLVLMASSHGGRWHASPYAGRAQPPAPSAAEQTALRIAFFDHHLKEPGDEVPAWPAVRYYNVGEEALRSAGDWPPPGVGERVLAPTADGRLLAHAEAAVVGYDVDFEVGTGSANRWATQMGGPVRGLDQRAPMDARMLVFDTPALAEPLQLAGAAVLELRMSVDREDAAVLVYLHDVDADGRSRYLTEGGLRLLHRKLTVDRAPMEPLHSFAEADALPLRPGEVETVTVALQPVAARLPAGHRLRLAVAGADAHTFARVPAAGAVHFVVHCGPAGSRLRLPVVE